MTTTEELRPYVEELKNHLEDYIKSKVPGYIHGKNFRCLNPDHEDKNPSMAYNAKNHYCHCFGCNVTYDIINLLAIDYDKDCKNPKDFIDIIYQGCKDFGIYIPEQNYTKSSKPKNGKEYFDECHKHIIETKYYEKRGISHKTIDHFNLGFDPHYPLSHNKFMQAAIIPRGDFAYTARNTYPNAESAERYRKQGNTRNTFLNIEALDKSQPIFIVEGEFDALSIIEAGFEAIALGSVDNYIGFLEVCKTKKINQYLLISLDNDEAGENYSKELIQGLKTLNIKAEKVNVSLNFKDANEALVNDPQKFKNNLFNILKKLYEKNVNANILKSIIQIISKFPQNKWPKIKEALTLTVELKEEEQNEIFEYIRTTYDQKKGNQ